MRYERRASPLHAARAVVGASWALALATTALLYTHPLVAATVIAIAVAAGVLARVGGRVALMLWFAVPFALLIALVNPFVSRDGLTVIWRFGEIPPFGELDITLEAVIYGALLGARALALLLSTAVMSATVDPDGLLRVFRRVSFRTALTAALGVRLVPVLGRDARRLDEARRCRAEPPGRVAVARAVASGALDRAADVAATLEVRGYRGGIPPSAAGREPWSRHDLGFAASAVAIVALAVAGKVAGLADVVAYPETLIDFGASEVGLCSALALVALLPFADRRGIDP